MIAVVSMIFIVDTITNEDGVRTVGWEDGDERAEGLDLPFVADAEDRRNHEARPTRSGAPLAYLP